MPPRVFLLFIDLRFHAMKASGRAAPSAAEPAPIVPQGVLSRDFAKLFAGFFCFMVSMSIFNLLPHYLELRGAGGGMYGAIAGTMGLTSFAAILLLGHTADRWSRKTTVSAYLGIALLANGVAVAAMWAPLEWYFFTRVLQGLPMAIALPLLSAWAMECSPPGRKHEVVAWLGVAGLLAESVGPLLAETILTLQPGASGGFSYLPVFLAAGVFMLAAQGSLLTARDARAAPDEGSGARGLPALLLAGDSVLVLALATVFGGVFGVFISFGKNYVTGVGLEFSSVLFGAYTGGALVIRIFITPLIRYVTPRYLIPCGFLAVGAAFFLLGRADSYLALSVSGLVYGFGHGVLYPTLFVRFVENQRPSEIGRASILVLGFFSGGWGLFPYLGGFILEQAGFPTLFNLLAAVAVGSIVLHLLTERRRRAARGTP